MAKEEREVKFWYTTSTGRHIPVFEGETKADAVKRAFGDNRANSGKTASNSQSKPVEDKQSREMAQAKERATALNAEQEYKDRLVAGSKIEKKNGGLTFNGKPVDKLDTSDAGTKGKDSLADHINEKGELSPKRLEVHRQIMEDYFKGRVGLKEGQTPVEHQPYGPNDEKVAMFTGGGGASGKGAFGKNPGKFYSQNKNPLVIDPDEIKKQLAKADGKELNDELTGYYHEESSALAKQIFSTSLQNNYPTMFDGTATGVGSTLKKVALAEKHGYKTEMSFVFSDWSTVRQNSLDRYENTGRLVPPAQLLGAHQKAYGAVTELQDKFDSFKVYDNAGRDLKLVGSQTGKQKLKITNTESFARFSKSADEFKLSTDEIDRYYADVAKIKQKKYGK